MSVSCRSILLGIHIACLVPRNSSDAPIHHGQSSQAPDDLQEFMAMDLVGLYVPKICRSLWSAAAWGWLVGWPVRI